MLIVPIALLGVLVLVVFIANSQKKKGAMSEAAYNTLVSVASIIVTIAALIFLFLRLRG
jgi:cbb3-type cytochrome oxidase subunit 3